MKRPVASDLVGLELPTTSWSWGWRDAILYALGIGGRPGPGALDDPDSADEGDIDFLLERRGPKVYPTLAVIPAMNALMQVSEVVDLDIARMLHGEQRITLHRPFPASGSVRVAGKIVECWDKGSAAVIGLETDLFDEAEPDAGPIASTYASLFAKRYGGFGGERGPDTSGQHVPPDRAPDHVVTDVVRPEQAAIYRLSGDRVMLHIDPQFARKAGYPGPFLHGLCTYGFVGRAVLRTLCDNEPARLAGFGGRFADLVWMNDEIITSMWDEGDGNITVQASTSRGKVVLSQAHATIKA